MKCGKSPRRPGVLIIDNNERRDRIGYGEPPKNINWDVCVMAAKVSKEQYIHAHSLPKITESQFDGWLSSKLIEREV
jgi:hypothetical protein